MRVRAHRFIRFLEGACIFKQMKWLVGSMVLTLGIGTTAFAQVRPSSGSRNVNSDQQRQQLLPDDTGGKGGAAGGKGGQTGGQGGAGGKGGGK